MNQTNSNSESAPADKIENQPSWKTGLYSQEELDPHKMDKAIAQLKILNEYLRISSDEKTTDNKEVTNEKP